MPLGHTCHVNLRRIEYFLAVVDAGTVTAAAERLHIAQPALSRQIKTLERELKLALFEPKANRLSLTQAGRAFVPAARRMMVEARGVQETAAALRTGKVASLVVAATHASVHGFLAPFIATTGSGDPLLITRETSHFSIPEALLLGADFAVSPAPPAPGLATMSLGSVAVQAYVAADHRWAVQGINALPLAEICREHAILPSHGSASRHLLDDALNLEHLAFPEVSECDDGQTILALAAAGHGIGITTDRPRFGVHGLRILTRRPGKDAEPDVLQLPLHATWTPGHFAEATIRSISASIRSFLETEERGL